MRPEFDTSKIRSIRSASLTEFTMISDNVARVIATFVGQMDKEDASDRVTAVLGGRAHPIKSSFRWLTPGRVAIGYVALTRAVRAFIGEGKGYHKIKANMFMDPRDESLWELKPGTGGKYLARQGTDNLAELLEASRQSPRGSIPRMSMVLSASVQKQNFVAFVDTKAEMLDHGFCVESKEDGGFTVVSALTGLPVEVPGTAVVSVHTVDLPDRIRAAITPKTKVKAAFDTSTMIDYYKRAYNFDPAYVELVIKQIEQMAAL